MMDKEEEEEEDVTHNFIFGAVMAHLKVLAPAVVGMGVNLLYLGVGTRIGEVATVYSRVSCLFTVGKYNVKWINILDLPKIADVPWWMERAG